MWLKEADLYIFVSVVLDQKHHVSFCKQLTTAEMSQHRETQQFNEEGNALILLVVTSWQDLLHCILLNLIYRAAVDSMYGIWSLICFQWLLCLNSRLLWVNHLNLV